MPTPPLFAYGKEFSNVRLTPAQLLKLNARWGPTLTQERIEHFSKQKQAHGYSYKNDYAALLAWWPQDDEVEARADDPTPEMVVARKRQHSEFQKQWDREAAAHQHNARCQFGSVCRYVPAKRPQ